MFESFFQSAKEVIQDDKLYRMFKQCFLSSMDSSIKQVNDKTYVITGDIQAMWLRDSSCQVYHYLRFCKENEELCEIIKGLIKTQIEYVLLDPYANAFLDVEDVKRAYHDTTIMKPFVWERKYELDSLCYPVKLSYEYYKQSGDGSIFNNLYLKFIYTILDVFEREQYHSEKSSYTFEREMAKVWDLRKTETLQDHGKGFSTRYTGLTWSAFRPSDDACALNYNIPGNMFCSVILGFLHELVESFYHLEELKERIVDLKFQIDYGIELFGVVHHPKYGKIYAYETDGFGNHILMDDANVPSLLSMPYIGYCQKDDELYLNTRKFILSQDNPYYYKGKDAAGVGSPHTWPRYIWPIALCIQGLTSNSQKEKEAMVKMIVDHCANTLYCHESFDVDDDSKYTREWFCWANSLFAELVIDTYFL